MYLANTKWDFSHNLDNLMILLCLIYFSPCTDEANSGNAVLATILTKFERAVRTVELMRRDRGRKEKRERVKDG